MTRSRWPAHIWVAAAAVLAASCDSCWNRVRPAELANELVAGRLIAVIVSPGDATVAPGGTQSFSATGLLDDGSSIGVAVTWTATGGVVTAAGLYTAGTAPGTFRVIAAQQGGTMADTSVVTIVAGTQPPTGGLAVEVSGAPSSLQKWVLLDTDTTAVGALACPQDLVVTFSGPSVIVGTLGACATQVSVYAPGFAPVLDLAPVPTQVAGRPSIAEALPPAWSVKLHVVGEYPEAAIEADADRILASELSDANRLGIHLVLDGPVTLIDPTVSAAGVQDPLTTAIIDGCAAVAKETALRRPGHLNVMYVRDGQWRPAWKTSAFYGYNCYKEGHPDIIFIREGHAPATLMHEIGHALSLHHAGFGPGALGGWPTNNLMRSAIWSPTTTVPLEAFSLGQVYRANFHDVSWLVTGLVRTGAVTHCTDESLGATSPPVTWPCPSLQLAWP